MKPYLTYDSRPESLQTLEDVSSLCFPSSAIFAFLCIRLLAGRWLVDKIRRLSLTSGCYRMTSAFQCWVSISCFCHPSLNFIFFNQKVKLWFLHILMCWLWRTNPNHMWEICWLEEHWGWGRLNWVVLGEWTSTFPWESDKVEDSARILIFLAIFSYMQKSLLAV